MSRHQTNKLGAEMAQAEHSDGKYSACKLAKQT